MYFTSWMSSFENCIVIDFFFNGAKTERERDWDWKKQFKVQRICTHTHTLMCLCTGKKWRLFFAMLTLTLFESSANSRSGKFWVRRTKRSYAACGPNSVKQIMCILTAMKSTL